MIHDPFVLSRFDAYDDDDTEKGFYNLLINFFVEMFTTHVLLLNQETLTNGHKSDFYL